MNAREKLNAAYVQGALILAAVVGVLAQSWIAFGFTLAVLICCAHYDGAIRIQRHKR
jgi:type IV secretory pathway TrbD component